MNHSARTIAFNCTAYDELPSGARERAVGLAAGLLRLGASVRFYLPGALSLRPAIEEELGHDVPAYRFTEVATPLDPMSPATRAVRSARWFRRNLHPADLFVTDYYPVVEHVRTALTIHDLRYLASPADEPRRRVLWFRTFYARLAAAAPCVIVPTAAVGAEASFHLGLDPERMSVVPNGIARRILASTGSRPESTHLLWIGTAELRKRLRFLLRAYGLAASQGTVLPLVLAGRGAEPDVLPEEADALIERGLVRAAGVVAHDELAVLLRGAAALLHPSRYEGFGMPVAEAIALGTPVVAAQVPAVEEVARGGATLLPADDLARWTETIVQVGGDERVVVTPRQEAIDEVRAGTWEAAARALLAVLDD